MGLEEAIEVGVIGVGSLYALDKLTGKRKRKKTQAKKSAKRSPRRKTGRA